MPIVRIREFSLVNFGQTPSIEPAVVGRLRKKFTETQLSLNRVVKLRACQAGPVLLTVSLKMIRTL